MHLSEEWCSYNVAQCSSSMRETQLTSLRVKIKTHLDSVAHKTAGQIQDNMKSKRLETIASEMKAAADSETEAVFRTAYNLAKQNRPFTDHENLIMLQKLNGAKLGQILHSRYSATAIVDHIANTMRKRLVNSLLESNNKISILIDESTSLSKKSVLIVYGKAAVGDGEPVFMFLDLVELDSQTADSVTSALENCLKSAGFTETYLQANWIGFVTDGASVMLGRHSGVATQLRKKYPHLFTWHCLNHRLELAVGDAARDVCNVFHFKSFLDSLYSLFSQSTKNNRELRDASLELGTRILRIGRVLDMRWVASSYRTVNAVWVSFAALAHHFQQAGSDSSRDCVERKKYDGLRSRLTSTEFVCDLGLLHDVLRELSDLSQQLQTRSITLMRSQLLIKRTIRVLDSFKDTPGQKLEEALKAKEELNLRGVKLKSNPKLRSIPTGQFLQCLIDRMSSRLCDDAESSFMEDLSIFDQSSWIPDLPIRHGEKEVRRISQRFHLDVDQAIRGMRDFIENPAIESVDQKPILHCIRSIPCSSAECERGFSLMNNIETDLRTTLLVLNISNLMFININGPPLHLIDFGPFVTSWNITHRLATDTQSRQCKSKPDDDHNRHALWKVCAGQLLPVRL